MWGLGVPKEASRLEYEDPRKRSENPENRSRGSIRLRVQEHLYENPLSESPMAGLPRALARRQEDPLR